MTRVLEARFEFAILGRAVFELPHLGPSVLLVDGAVVIPVRVVPSGHHGVEPCGPGAFIQGTHVLVILQ